MRKIFFIMVAILILPFLAVACGEAQPSKDEGKNEFASLGDWSVRVNGYSVVDRIKVNGRETTDIGCVYVKIDMTFANNSDTDRAFMSGMFTMDLDDLKGNRAANELFVEGGLDTADVKAGQTVDGSFFFKMSGDMNLDPAGMKLSFTNIGQKEYPTAEVILK
jgi:hypothetical protein